MEIKDIEYIAINLSDLCGVPIRIYKKDKSIFWHSLLQFPKDPAILNIKDILSIEESIGYITTIDFFYYGIVKHKDYRICIGPFRLITPEDSILTKMTLDLELSKEDIEQYISSMKLINPMPLQTILQSLCMVNFILNKEKKSITDILVDNEKAESYDMEIQSTISDKQIDEIELPYTNNSFAIEQELYRMVEHGEIDELKIWLSKIPAVRPGVMSKDSLRQAKNTFIAAITLISRSAIKGQMDPIDALSLSDLYIQKMELLNSIPDIYTLQMNMVLDYTERVAKIKGKRNASAFLINLNKYIISHLSEAIKVPDICDALYISKSTLFDKLKKETNMTVSEYILSMKVNESKGLLKYTNKSITAISIYLGFSSQSHYNHTFKHITGMTPKDYRTTHK